MRVRKRFLTGCKDHACSGGRRAEKDEMPEKNREEYGGSSTSGELKEGLSRCRIDSIRDDFDHLSVWIRAERM